MGHKVGPVQQDSGEAKLTSDAAKVNGDLVGSMTSSPLFLKRIILSTLWRAQTQRSQLELLHAPAVGLN